MILGLIQILNNKGMIGSAKVALNAPKDFSFAMMQTDMRALTSQHSKINMSFFWGLLHGIFKIAILDVHLL